MQLPAFSMLFSYGTIKHKIMKTTISPYLNFNGKCREAMSFYKSCIGGELSFLPVAGTQLESQCPSEMKDQILHASLVKDELVLMGSDMVHKEHIHGNNVSISVNCSSEAEIQSFFSNLAQEGAIMDPLKEQFWGAVFGALTDKYGIRWMFNYAKNENGAN
jgi:PhnB protein